MSVSSVVGLPVVNHRGQELGRLGDIVIDPEEGVIAYAVVACTLGPAAKRFAAPWDALRYDAGRLCMVWRVEAETLRQARGLGASFEASETDHPAERFGRMH